MAAAPAAYDSGDILSALLLCGLMGVLGQGVRAVVGLKNAAAPTTADGSPNQQAAFSVSYFSLSLMIGFIAGILAGLGIGLSSFMKIDPANMKLLLGVAASGYAGADFIENSFSNLIPGTGTTTTPTTTAAAAPAAAAQAAFVAPQISAAPDISGLKAALTVTSPAVNAGLWTGPLTAAFTRFDMQTNRRMAAAIGQFLVEAGPAFQELVEDMTYTHAAHIAATFPTDIPTAAAAAPYVGNPEALGNFVYANRNGNGNAASGDGYLFRGRGLCQITGRTAYTQFAAAIGKTLADTVPYLETPEGAAMSGCWYLAVNHCVPLADLWDISAITRIVNGAGMLGAAQRLTYANTALKALGG